MANSKAKGNAGERLICRILTKWLTGKEKPYALYRTPNSGGLATILNMHENFSGDIVGITEEGKKITNIFSLEIKTGYSDTSIDNILKYNKTENIKAFWEQCVNDANKAEKLPLLIYNKKGSLPKNIWIGFDENGLSLFNQLKKITNIRIKFDNDLPDLYIFTLDKFFETIKSDDIPLI